jgi:hypothetical protein
MHTYEKKRFHSFQADASALGGYLETPVSRLIPTAAPAALPAVGGFASARHEAFNLDGLISFSSARSWVTGSESSDKSFDTVATAVVEDLSILDVVTAKRVTAQVSVTIGEDGKRFISLAGSGFEGLRVAGHAEPLKANDALRRPGLEFGKILEAAREQATRLIHGSKNLNDSDAQAWTVNRFGTPADAGADGPALCSLVEDIAGGSAENRCGHFIVLPGFGRFFFGELWVSKYSVQYVSIRAELGCAIGGSLGGPTAQVSGGTTGGPDR